MKTLILRIFNYVGKSGCYNRDEKKCFRCGKKGHTIAECKRGDIVYFNCDEEGHFSSQCKKPRKTQASGKVFALTGTQTENDDRLIKGVTPRFPNIIKYTQNQSFHRKTECYTTFQKFINRKYTIYSTT